MLKVKVKVKVIEDKVKAIEDKVMDIRYKLLAHQKRFLQSTKNFTVLSCGRSAGKTFVASLLAALKLIQGKRLLVWAQNYKALSENLMTEIVKRLDEMKVPYHYNSSAMKITTNNGTNNGTIYGLSYENIEACRGFTEIEIALCDEIALAPATLLPTMAFCMRGENIIPHIYAMSTPRMNSWWNLYLKEHAEDIEVIHATMLDNKFITKETIELVKASCKDDNLLRQELYGELVDGNDAGTMFTNALLVKSNTAQWNNDRTFCLGIDCAGLGTDYNVITVRQGNRIAETIEKQVATSKELCTICLGLIKKYGDEHYAFTALDEAFGLDLAERLKDSGVRAVWTIPFGGSSTEKVYANMRAEMYFKLKKSIEETGLSGLSDEAISELVNTRYELNSANRLLLIPKSDIKLNIGRSPDIADSIALTYTKSLIANEAISARRERQASFMQ